MTVSILFPRFEHPAIEERHASLQSLDRLREFAGNPPVVRYSTFDSVRDLTATITSETVLLVTSPLVVTAPGLLARLTEALERTDAAAAAVPVSNDSEEPKQVVSRYTPYLTLREFEEYAATPADSIDLVTWGDADPGVALVRTSILRKLDGPAHKALAGLQVAIARGTVIHRWAALRAQTRDDLLALVDPAATSILDLGCAEGLFGGALKTRQECRVVGIEIDAASAAVAGNRMDRVVLGDAEVVVKELGESFDCITAGDVLEHVADPWTLLGNLRTVARPGCRLITAMPNAGHGSIAADLISGRFDYVYIGIACVGHLRFYTADSIRQTFRLAGWNIESMIPAAEFRTPASERLAAALRAGGLEPAPDFFVPGYYLVATPATPTATPSATAEPAGDEAAQAAILPAAQRVDDTERMNGR